jgi:hypothetical protein
MENFLPSFILVGHYTAYARNPITGNWYLFNDSSVSAVHDDGVSRVNVIPPQPPAGLPNMTPTYSPSGVVSSNGFDTAVFGFWAVVVFVFIFVCWCYLLYFYLFFM